MHKNRIILSVLAIWLAIVGCSLPQAPAAQGPANAPGAVPVATSMDAPAPGSAAITNTAPIAVTASVDVIPTLTQEPTATFTASPTPCVPAVVANSAVNVRSGPGTVYPILGNLSGGGSAPIAGKSADGTWWYIEFAGGAGGVGWVSGSVVTASCVPSSLSVIAAPPTPLPPSGSCKDGYVFRLANSSDKVCVPPASKAQADADNAAADSRKLVNVYGNEACIIGYFWREASSGDTVCVTAGVRSQTAADNAAAASRWVVGAYGPHTCLAGFVWREAFSGDDVCVTTDVHNQASADNAAASSRKAINADGPDSCIEGYVWRKAFTGDRVCVTAAVKSQVAADNAAAPSHTWP